MQKYTAHMQRLTCVCALWQLETLEQKTKEVKTEEQKAKNTKAEAQEPQQVSPPSHDPYATILTPTPPSGPASPS